MSGSIGDCTQHRRIAWGDSEPEGQGTTIGRYLLLEEIGEGGFGIVYLAEQFEPVQRKVALKIIKPGMDTREVVARFEVERQALALMDHPNIAKVLDGGATDAGRPYFVMELVRGVPIRSIATSTPCRRRTGCNSSFRFVTRSSTRTRRGSSTVT